MAMTKEDWDRLAGGLHYGFRTHDLLIDGFKIKLLTTTKGHNPLVREINIISINGENGWNFREDEIIRTRFLKKEIKCFMSPKYLNAFRKGKERDAEKLRCTRTHYVPLWTSFKALKAHLIKNNKEISLAKE
jgi:hypothetical protein